MCPSEPSRSPTGVFDADAGAYDDYLKTPLGRLRVELTWQSLWRALHRMSPSVDHLSAEALHVLDIGGGNGEFAVRLAERGLRVTLLDLSTAMLELAEARRRSLPEQAQSRLELRLACAERADEIFSPAAFDVVLCHSVLDYVPDADAMLGAVSAVLRPAGLLSCLVSNRDSEALRLSVLGKDLGSARAALHAQNFPTALFGGIRRAYSAAELRALLRRHGLGTRTERGVRIFADYLPQEHLVDPLLRRQLWRLEVAAAGKLPHRRLARYLHMLAVKQ